MPKKTDSVEVSLHPNWIALINFSGMLAGNSNLIFTTEGGVPMKLLELDERILFGKVITKPVFIKELTPTLVRVRITLYWAGLIQFCLESFPYARVGVKMANGEPKEPIYKETKNKIDFSHPETFPKVPRFIVKLGLDIMD